MHASDIVDARPGVLIAVTSNEPGEGLDDGDTAPDQVITPLLDRSYGVALRAERARTGDERRYPIAGTARERRSPSARCGGFVTPVARVAESRKVAVHL